MQVEGDVLASRVKELAAWERCLQAREGLLIRQQDEVHHLQNSCSQAAARLALAREASVNERIKWARIMFEMQQALKYHGVTFLENSTRV